MLATKAHPLAFAAGVIAAVLFAISLALPIATAHQTQGLNEIGGLELLFIGPFGALNAQFGWYATPCLIVAIVWLLRRRPFHGWGAPVLAAIMILLLADALRWRDYPNDGGAGPIVHYGFGYTAWIGAVLIGSIGLLIGRYARSRAATSTPTVGDS